MSLLDPEWVTSGKGYGNYKLIELVKKNSKGY